MSDCQWVMVERSGWFQFRDYTSALVFSYRRSPGGKPYVVVRSMPSAGHSKQVAAQLLAQGRFIELMDAPDLSDWDGCDVVSLP